MRRPKVMRILGYAFLLILLGGTFTVIAINLRGTTEIRQQLSSINARITQLSNGTESRIESLSRDLRDLSKGTQDEIASARRSTRGDVSRMNNRIAGRLSEMAERMELVAGVPQSLSEVQKQLDTMSEKLQRTSATPGSTAGWPGTALYEIDMKIRSMELEANALFREGRYEEASGKLALILEKQPANTDLRLKHAVSLFRANPSDSSGYAKTERELRSVLEAQGEIPMALEVLALLAAEKREWSEASAYFRRLLAVAPGDGRYLKEAGECSLYAGDLDTAQIYIEEAVRLLPQDEGVTALAVRLRGALSTGGSH